MAASLVGFQVLLPLALLAWLGLARPGHGPTALLQVVAVGGALVALARAGMWLFPPWWVAWLYGIVFVPVAAVALRRARVARPWHRRAAIHGVLALALLAAATALLVAAVRGRSLPDGPVVDLAFPLHGGPFLIANGGSTRTLNPHLETLDATEGPLVAYRGQSYALDIVGIDALGFRLHPGARGRIQVSNAEGYVIFDEPVHAACTGTVVVARDDRPDMPVSEIDRTVLAGNHVSVRCGEVVTVYAHLRAGSVAVSEGDRVDVSTVLGRVGNSGQSYEPHLHFHAQRPRGDDRSLAGDPVWTRFGGRFLVRNDRASADPQGRLR